MAQTKTVCVDLDGVLLKYDRWRGAAHFGEPIEGAAKFMAALKERGAKVVVFTTRCNEAAFDEYQEGVRTLHDRVKGHLEANDIPFDEIYIGQGKPLAAAYVDDRAVACRPQDGDPSMEFRATLEIVDSLLSPEEDK